MRKIKTQTKPIPKKPLPPMAIDRLYERGLSIPVIWTNPPELIEEKRSNGKEYSTIRTSIPASRPGLLTPKSFSWVFGMLLKKRNADKVTRERQRSASQQHILYKGWLRPATYINRILKVMK